MHHYELWKACEDYDQRQFLIFETLHLIIEQNKTIMANQQDLEAEVQEVKQTVSDAAARVVAKITDLENQIAAGANGPDLAPQIQELKDAIAPLSNLGA